MVSGGRGKVPNSSCGRTRGRAVSGTLWAMRASPPAQPEPQPGQRAPAGAAPAAPRIETTAIDTPVIDAIALTKIYPGNVTALNGLTVSFGKGVTGLIGANGAGKST